VNKTFNPMYSHSPPTLLPPVRALLTHLRVLSCKAQICPFFCF